MLIETIFRIGRAQYGPGASLGPRQTIGFEFVRILKGNIDWRYDGVLYHAKPGDWILSQPGHEEHYTWDRRSLSEHDHIHFTLENNSSNLPASDFWPVLVNFRADNLMQSLFEQIIKLNRSNHPQRTFLMKIAVQQMLYIWVYRINELPTEESELLEVPVQRVVDVAQKKWSCGEFKPLPMQHMIEIACVSRSSFLRSFVRQCKLSPSRFFEYQRLYLGRMHLLESNRTIEQIADILDYSSPFHFSKNFKQLFACSPSDIRRSKGHIHNTIEDYVFQKVFNVLFATQTL
jgi:AraC-like DNA-binding protein